MSNLKVNIAGVEFKNPIITASGTFGFGREYSNYYDYHKRLFAHITNCTSNLFHIFWVHTKRRSTCFYTLLEKAGNPAPRVTEIKSGMINCVGLQNPGVDYFLKEHLPWLMQLHTRQAPMPQPIRRSSET